MNLTRVCLLSLGCVGGAVAFGVAANAALDLVMPLPARKPEPIAIAKPAEPAEQEEYWLAIAAELRALGKAMKANARHNGGKLSVDQDTIQRLYWAAAPLITRLSYEQKMKAKQMARLMGLNQVAEAL